MAGNLGGRARTAYPLKKGGNLAEPLWLKSVVSALTAMMARDR